MNLNKRAKTIINLSIATLIVDAIAIIAIIICIIIPVSSDYGWGYDYGASYVFKSTVYVGIGFVVSLLLLIIAFILYLAAVIMLFTTNWQDQKLQGDRVLWGLLSLFLLGAIGTLVFGIQAKNAVLLETTIEPRVAA